MDDVRKEVEEAVNGDGAGSSPVETPEIVSPEGVKPEVAPEVVPEVKPDTAPNKTPDEKVEDIKNSKDEGTLQVQVANLTKALQIERESGKGTTTKMSELEEQLSAANETIGKLKDVFVPPEESKVPFEPEVFTKEQAEQMWADKEKAKQEESTNQSKAEMIKQEISELSTEWDGAEGKPSYEDNEVLEWQQEQGKLYLTPKEAFNEMKRNEIIDWEVKQRLSGKKNVQDVEKPSVGSDVHEPGENKISTDPVDIRKAVVEAIDSADADI